jgi:hypothetical protein
MGYDLHANNQELDSFHFGAFSWIHLLEQCGTYFVCLNQGPKWYCVFEADERMGTDYPELISNDGFPVTSEEAHVLARIARNYVAVQNTLGDDAKLDDSDFMKPAVMQVWPRKYREDWNDLFIRFAEWADKSDGFQIH